MQLQHLWDTSLQYSTSSTSTISLLRWHLVGYEAYERGHRNEPTNTIHTVKTPAHCIQLRVSRNNPPIIFMIGRRASPWPWSIIASPIGPRLRSTSYLGSSHSSPKHKRGWKHVHWLRAEHLLLTNYSCRYTAVVPNVFENLTSPTTPFLPCSILLTSTRYVVSRIKSHLSYHKVKLRSRCMRT